VRVRTADRDLGGGPGSPRDSRTHHAPGKIGVGGADVQSRCVSAPRTAIMARPVRPARPTRPTRPDRPGPTDPAPTGPGGTRPARSAWKITVEAASRGMRYWCRQRAAAAGSGTSGVRSRG